VPKQQRLGEQLDTPRTVERLSPSAGGELLCRRQVERDPCTVAVAAKGTTEGYDRLAHEVADARWQRIPFIAQAPDLLLPRPHQRSFIL
jgi:hypothetical protein